MTGVRLERFLREAAERCPSLPILRGEPMSRHCSFRVGGPCTAMLLPSSADETLTLCRLLREEGEKP